MVRLSININKVATLRNSRGGENPSVLRAVEVCVGAGAPGITVHPRHDQRHIRPADVVEVATFLRGSWPGVEYNIEGDPRPELIEMVDAIKPDQCTLVPVRPGELTSEAGWPADTPHAEIRSTVERLRDQGIRVSLFVDPEPAPIEWAGALGADRVELYTEPYARAFEAGGERLQDEIERYTKAARIAHDAGLGVNAGHDLDLRNLPAFLRVPHVEEVSIGHALISEALFVGLGEVVREYVDVLAGH